MQGVGRRARQGAARLTVGAVLERYRREVTPGKRGASAEDYRLRAICRRPLASIPLIELASPDIATYRDARLACVAPATVTRELIVIAHALEIARREWGIGPRENPVRFVRRPRATRGRDRRLRGDEEARLLAACAAARNPSLLPVVRLALETAMRQGEIVSLARSDIDRARRIALLKDTKNGHHRAVPLSPAALAVIDALPEGPGRLFGALTTGAVKRAFRRASCRAGLQDLRFHDLRHEATSRLFERGLSTMEVATITGHRTLAMLYRYAHLDAEALARKLAGLSDA